MQKYNLTWRSYSDHLREAQREMMTSSEFADVTLVTDDKQQIRAHRNILSACSPVFKTILQLDSNANPVIYLRGIQHSEMESIMKFIYLGEARIYEERINAFLMVSKNLEIRELSTGMEINYQFSSNEESNENEKNVVEVDEDRNVHYQPHTSTEPLKTIFISENKKIDITEGVENAFNQCDQQFTQQNDLTRHIQSKHGGVKHACNQCDYQATRKDNLTKHIQSKHEGVKYACNQCDYQATFTSSLTKHIQSKHEGVRYVCNECDYQATIQGNLTQHIKSVHEGVKYACSQCDYQATQQSNLAQHIKSAHEGIKYACSQCDYQGPRQANLKSHIKSKHLGKLLHSRE